jgi:hypothetical protein
MAPKYYIIPPKFLVIVIQTREKSYLMDFPWLLPILNYPYMQRIHVDASFPNPMAQEWNFSFPKDTQNYSSIIDSSSTPQRLPPSSSYPPPCFQ